MKDRITRHLIGVGRMDTLNTVRKYEGQDVGIDNIHITPNEALVVGINKYHLPKRLARTFGAPAIEHSEIVSQSDQPSVEQLVTLDSQSSERSRIVITKESLEDR